MHDPATVAGLAGRAAVLTNEFEQIPPEALAAAERMGEKTGCRIAPSSLVQKTCRDRRLEKGLFAKYGFPHGAFAVVEREAEMVPAYEKLSVGGAKRVVAKIATGGYDGKGANGVDEERGGGEAGVAGVGGGWETCVDVGAGSGVCGGGECDCGAVAIGGVGFVSDV